MEYSAGLLNGELRAQLYRDTKAEIIRTRLRLMYSCSPVAKMYKWKIWHTFSFHGKTMLPWLRPGHLKV